MIKVHFIHGLESSAHGNKARLFAEHFDALTPAMDTADFEGCVSLHAKGLVEWRPDVVVGSSFGGAVLCALIQRGLWDGRSLLLAQAGVRHGLGLALPSVAPIWIVHGSADDVVAPSDSARLAASNARPNVRLIEVDDDHALHRCTQDGTLLGWVKDLAALDG
ncbi:MAG: hypothetical protein HOI95_06880 [Chromatiales bacterium]|nr:hypothetical protein [Chromatiales bacterium]